MNKKTSREVLVQEIAEALQTHFDESQSYLNLTTQEVGMWIDTRNDGYVENCKLIFIL